MTAVTSLERHKATAICYYRRSLELQSKVKYKGVVEPILSKNYISVPGSENPLLFSAVRHSNLSIAVLEMQKGLPGDDRLFGFRR